MTAVSYRRSAELAGIVGPYNGYARNAAPHTAVMRKHADATAAAASYEDFDKDILELSKLEWAAGLEIGAVNGWRNAQASLLAPTGFLTADTLVTTDRAGFPSDQLGEVYAD